ncbi:MAG TPA: hypothetical protein H9873_09745 [Candidatus Dorea gallistercoris]|uniref:Leucine-rich repeat domain-containing protein n=1 Tax=Candidatus Dorea gallistercoris TaxID=2838542 RepID=A0A9D1RDB9_9FIRM|nr:hypothetical protein [Candidatus Dorea gallistercoris]
MRKWIKNGLSLSVLSFFLLFPLSVSAETPGDANDDGYYDNDVAVINSLITNHGLNLTPDSPEEWESIIQEPTPPVVTWVTADDGLKHVGNFNLNVNSVAGGLKGNVDLTALSEVTEVWVVGQQELTGLNVSGLSKLTRLTCQSNQISSLNVSGAGNLEYLDCQSNQISSLDVSGLTKLSNLRCAINNIEVLDMKGLTGLKEVWITGNPYQSIVFPDGDTLTLSSNEGGYINTWEVDVANKTIEVMPQPDDGYFFKGWDPDLPSGSEYTPDAANTIWGIMGTWKIPVNGNLAVSGTFSPIMQYPILEGENGTWTQGSQGGLTVRADVEFEKFTGVMVDDVEVDPQYYTVASGSTIVSLKPEFLGTLSEGAHEMVILFDDGQATTGFQIRQAGTGQTSSDPQGGSGTQTLNVQNTNGNTSGNTNAGTVAEKAPQTSDDSMPALLAILMLISGAAAAVVLRMKRMAR